MISMIVLHQKQISLMQFNMIFYTELLVSSKHLEFLSFQIVRRIQARTILHLSLSATPAPTSSQLKRTLVIFLGIVHTMPLRFVKVLHNWSVTLQCKNRWLTVSIFLPSKIASWTNGDPAKTILGQNNFIF